MFFCTNVVVRKMRHESKRYYTKIAYENENIRCVKNNLARIPCYR